MPCRGSVRPLSLPTYHRQVLNWLFQDLVLWLIEADQIKSFHPYRKGQSSINQLFIYFMAYS